MTVLELREWANKRVQEHQRIMHGKYTTSVVPITRKIKGSSGNSYTLTTFGNGTKTCSCPGFVYRRKCKHLSTT